MTAVPKTVAEAIEELRDQEAASRSMAKDFTPYSWRGAEYVGEARAYRDAIRLLEQMEDGA